MIDTNVVVDFLMGRKPGCVDCAKLMAMHHNAEIAVCLSALTLKDVFFTISMQLKRTERQATGSLNESMAKAANEIAWSCVRRLVDDVIVVPTGRAESLQAFVLRSVHGDFEDNLIVAAAQHANVDFLVSNDKALIAHAPITCLSSSDTIAFLEAEQFGV